MPEYIEREAALTAILNVPDGNWNQGRYANEVKAIHSADVEPVRHGRWEKVEDFDGDCHWMCSSCGCEWYFEAGGPVENGSNYCPNCGARMEIKS